MYTLFLYSRSFTNLPVGQGIRPLFHVMAHSIPLCDKMGCRYSGLDHCKKQVQTLVTNNLRKWLLTPIYRNIKSLQEFQGIIESCVLPFPMVVWQLYLHLPMQPVLVQRVQFPSEVSLDIPCISAYRHSLIFVNQTLIGR